MKTLDEVIKALEYCTGFDFVRCQDCPGYSEPDCGIQNDVLHYLKHLQEYYEMSREHHEPNPALTWEQLKQMERKPVWVESSDSLNRRRWMFVGEWFDDDEMRLFDMGNDYPDYVSKNGYESGIWQAYRKERE